MKLLCFLLIFIGVVAVYSIDIPHCTKNTTINLCSTITCGKKDPSCLMGCVCDVGYHYDPAKVACVLPDECTKTSGKRKRSLFVRLPMEIRH